MSGGAGRRGWRVVRALARRCGGVSWQCVCSVCAWQAELHPLNFTQRCLPCSYSAARWSRRERLTPSISCRWVGRAVGGQGGGLVWWGSSREPPLLLRCWCLPAPPACPPTTHLPPTHPPATVQAALKAMEGSAAALPSPPDFVLVDGNRLPKARGMGALVGGCFAVLRCSGRGLGSGARRRDGACRLGPPPPAQRPCLALIPAGP